VSASDDRAAILRRRARFVAAAVAGLAALDGCARDAEPQVCLEPQRADPVEIPAVDGGSDDDGTETDAGLSAADGGSNEPVVPEPAPRVCLSDIE